MGKSCFTQTIDAATVGGLTGAGLGAVQAAWVAKPQAGNRTLPLLVASGITVGKGAGLLAGCATVYAGTKCGVTALRGKDDVFTSMIAGCTAGATVGLKNGRIIESVGGCTALAAMAGLVKLSGELRPAEQTSMKYVDAVKKLNADK
eukprot:m.160587 g.160587  ORF g.160587 m.160587 type:complete len:147 (-) comp31187_c2_seq1:191-631(-)